MKLASARVVPSAILLAAVVAGALWVWHLSPDAAGGEPGTYRLDVVGPGAHSMFNGTVDVAQPATALLVLQAWSNETGTPVVVTRHPSVSPTDCGQAYVQSIGGDAAHGGSGWVYEVWHQGTWRFGEESAACHALHAGDRVRWSWTDGRAAA